MGHPWIRVGIVEHEKTEEDLTEEMEGSLENGPPQVIRMMAFVEIKYPTLEDTDRTPESPRRTSSNKFLPYIPPKKTSP